MQDPAVHRSVQQQPDHPDPARLPSPASRDIKLLQCTKIAELRQALFIAGFRSLDSQALALGLRRSSTWSVLRAQHKSSGLTASTIRQILSSSKLPGEARQVVEQYVAQKLAGAFGHDKKQLRRFRAGLATESRRGEALTPVRVGVG